ncbi:MAG: transposase [Clostridia bacterium]|nr:transposase [Clostridia bacterium]
MWTTRNSTPAAGIRFVTRLKGNAVSTTCKVLAVDPKGPILREAMVFLGRNGVNKMAHPLRLIQTIDSLGSLVEIVTNDQTRSALESAEIYRLRWQIELFFKWLKQHLSVEHFYGLTQRVVENQLAIALATYCLVRLLQLKTGYKGALLEFTRLLRSCLTDASTSFVVVVQRIFTPCPRSKKGEPRTALSNHGKAGDVRAGRAPG